ncbi:MAG: DNRLRE domain-containing protein, partial [Armatimonadetes bacterium]|nr:DNRLRE domain-containing protein [Armatimonadota bacterium]
MLRADIVTLQPGGEGQDAFVGQMTAGANYGSNTALASGQGPDFGGSEKRSFVQFDLSSIPAGATINSATLSLYVSQAAGGAQTASAYKVTSTWDEAAVNWNSQPSSDATAVSSVAVNSTGWKSWTITSLVASWCNGSVTNNGVVVKQSSGSPPNNVQFYSGDYGGDATLRPKLVVDYTTVNNPPTAVSLNTPTNITDTTLDLSWSQNGDADFQSYKLYRSTTPGVTEASTLVSSIQNQASCAFTDTGLTATTAVYYRVFVFDTGGLSSGSNEVSATTASPPPPPPSVANLSVSATPTSIVADNAAQSTITATLTDVNNQPVADHVVDFTTTAGTLSAASATSNAQGNASVTLTSGTTAGTAQITSTSSGLTGTCSVTFTAPPPAPAPTLTVTANPATLTADGASQSTITATLMDGTNQPMAGQTINFQTPAGTLTPTSAMTNVQGIATATLTSGTQAATPTITATSTSATGTCSLTFTGGFGGVTISVAVTPTLITADGQSTSTVSATVTDNGQPPPDGTTVTFTTDWGSFEGANPATPGTLAATTVNGAATLVLLSSNTQPANSSFTVTASALGAQGTATGQTQAEETYSTRIVVHWLQPTLSFDPCITHGETKSGGGAVHFYWIVPPGSAPIPNHPGALMGFTSFRAYEYDKDHKGLPKHPG